MTDSERPGPPPDPTSLSREYLVLTRRARTDGVSIDEESRRRSLRALLLALGQKQRQTPVEGHARAFVRAPLQLSLWFGSAAEFARAFAVSLGQGGLLLHTRNPWPAGSSVTLDFRRGVLGRVRATVVWSDAAAMGVRFDDLTEEQEDEVTEMVAWALAERVLDLAGGGRRQLRPGVGLKRPPATPPPPPPPPIEVSPEVEDEEEVTPRPMALPPRRSLDAAREARARKALGVGEPAPPATSGTNPAVPPPATASSEPAPSPALATPPRSLTPPPPPPSARVLTPPPSPAQPQSATLAPSLTPSPSPPPPTPSPPPPTPSPPPPTPSPSPSPSPTPSLTPSLTPPPPSQPLPQPPPPPPPRTPTPPPLPLSAIRRPTPPPLPAAALPRPTPPPLPTARLDDPPPAAEPDAEEPARRTPALRPGVGPVKK